MYMYCVLCICYIGGIRILERLSWGMAQKRLGNTDVKSKIYKIIFQHVVLYECENLFLTWREENRDSAVGIATGYWLDGRGSIPVRGKKYFSTTRRPDRLWSTPSFISNGYRGALSPGVKWTGREADHSHPSSAEVKKTWIYTAIPPYAFMA
jgi:hypothetical protein